MDFGLFLSYYLTIPFWLPLFLVIRFYNVIFYEPFYFLDVFLDSQEKKDSIIKA